MAAQEVEVGRYLAGLALPLLCCAPVATWLDAKRAALAPIPEPSWWEAEETLRRDLLGAATAAYGESAALDALTAITHRASESAIEAAAMAAARAGVVDPALIRAAAGAATQAAYFQALALLAGAGEDGPFAAKYRLFAAGHWPIGVVAGRYVVF